MKRISLYDWVQLITGFAIVIGIVLVLVEQYQARVIAEIQLARDMYADNFAFKRQIMGENPAPTLAKSCLEPDKLSESELAVALAYHDYRYDSMVLMKRIAETVGMGADWKETSLVHMRAILSTPLGRTDFRLFGDDPTRWDPDIAEFAREVMADLEDIRCENLYGRLMESL